MNTTPPDSTTMASHTSNDAHAVARALCHAKHGDWRYDPGNDKHRKWYVQARVLLTSFDAAHLRVTGRHNG